ncbi:MAG: histidine kinase [Phaeodactylibacter sp.]|nr:histidine kinase [Phaeodactylibacter sp.]
MEMKRWAPISKLQWYAFLATAPVLWCALNFILYQESALQDVRVWLLSIPLVGLPGLAVWLLHRMLDWRLKRRFGAMSRTGLRLSLQAASLLVVVAAFTWFVFWAYGRGGLLGYHWEKGDVQLGLLLALGLSFLVETLYEADFTFIRYRESREEVRSLEQQAENQELESLKSRINPHFLFNCFNTLSSLIPEDPGRATRFLDELSKVYRYLLWSNRQSLSTLDEEVGFIRSYCQLLKTRYGDALEVNIDVAPRYGGYAIPSLSLQLLAENAVKHNIVSRSQPLVIDIFTTDGNQLIVNNNLQRKPAKAPGARIGLENIRMKYQLLRQPGFQVVEDEKNFTVALPLIFTTSLNHSITHSQ